MKLDLEFKEQCGQVAEAKPMTQAHVHGVQRQDCAPQWLRPMQKANEFPDAGRGLKMTGCIHLL